MVILISGVSTHLAVSDNYPSGLDFLSSEYSLNDYVPNDSLHRKTTHDLGEARIVWDNCRNRSLMYIETSLTREQVVMWAETKNLRFHR